MVSGDHGRQQSPDQWPEVMPEPHEAELTIRDSDTIRHWIAVYREHIETSNEIAASMDLNANCARTDSSSATRATSCST
jgi:hypothetical protein